MRPVSNNRLETERDGQRGDKRGRDGGGGNERQGYYTLSIKLSESCGGVPGGVYQGLRTHRG